MQHHRHRHFVSIQLLTTITHATTGATGIGAAVGLPAGVTAAWAANTITISGTPTAAEHLIIPYHSQVVAEQVNATGTITVTASNTAGAAIIDTDTLYQYGSYTVSLMPQQEQQVSEQQ